MSVTIPKKNTTKGNPGEKHLGNFGAFKKSCKTKVHNKKNPMCSYKGNLTTQEKSHENTKNAQAMHDPKSM